MDSRTSHSSARCVTSLLPIVALCTAPCANVASAAPRPGEGGAGHKTVVVARTGSDANDATAAVQRAIDSDADTVVIPFAGSPWIVTPLRLRSGMELVLEPGVVLEAKRGSFKATTDSVLLAENVHDVSITGYGATIRMHKEDYKSWSYKKGEWRHGICLKGAENVSIRGLHIERTGGDGIYVGPTWDNARNTCTKIRIADCQLDENYRQGITIVSGVDVRVENCRITNTSGTAPQAGVDIEPGNPRDHLTAIHVKNCVALGNAGSGFMANVTRMSRKSEPISVRIEGCLVRGSVQPGLRAILDKDHGGQGRIEFVDCTVEDTQYSGAAVRWDTNSKIAVRFESCRWSDVAKRSGISPIWLKLVGSGGTSSSPSIEFDDAVVFERTERGVVHLEADGARPFPGVAGMISVEGPQGGAKQVSSLPNLRIQQHK